MGKAAYYGYTKTLKGLITRAPSLIESTAWEDANEKADKFVREVAGYTPLQLAIYGKGDPECIKLLI